MKNVALPLPRAVLEGLDLLQYHKELLPGAPGGTSGGVYILGSTYNGPVWYYYIVSSAIKFPIALLLLLAGSLIAGIRYFNKRSFFSNHIFYLFPLLFFFILLSCYNKFQSGIKHMLMIYPLLIICIAAFMFLWNKKWKRAKGIVWILFFSMIVSEAYYFPNLISYTNELLLDKKDVYKVTIDTNINYGQFARWENIFLQSNPAYTKAPLTPQQGKFILPIHDVFELRTMQPSTYEWLLKLKPVSHYKFCFLLYDVQEKDLEKIGR